MRIGETRVLIGVGLILLACAVAYAQTPSEITVVGTGTYPNDVQAVENAVNMYDIVYLQGTFDFEDRVVHIAHSVEILGEGTNRHGEYLTSILGGGYGAFTSEVNPNAEIVVRDIEFDGPEAALFITASERVEVTGCSIKNISAPWGGIGIRLDSNRVTGYVLIKENHFDVSAPGTWSYGLFMQSVFADVTIRDNIIENFHVTGLWVNSAGNIEISENEIIAGPPGPTPYRNGILVGSWYLPPGDRGDIEVTENTIIVGGHFGDSGITTEDFDPEVRDVCRVAGNVITFVDDSPGGFGVLLLSKSSNWTFEENTIDGGKHELLTGFAVYPGIDNSIGSQTGNVFRENHVFDADFGIGGVFIDSSAQASGNWFIENTFSNIGGSGFFVDGDANWFTENELRRVDGDGFVLHGDDNILRENKFNHVDGQDIVDYGTGNIY